MSLENHIEWARNIDSVHKSIWIQEKIRKIFWRSVPCLWEDFSIVETKETVYIQPIYDFSGVSPDERQELDETAWRNMKIISTALESDDMHSPLNLIRASDWIDKYRIWASIRLPNTKYQEGVIDIWGNLIPHPEYIWPFLIYWLVLLSLLSWMHMVSDQNLYQNLHGMLVKFEIEFKN